MNYTLITGACKGIGKALAHECASRGMNLLLVSNDRACLALTCQEIRDSYAVKCECYPVDLTEEGAAAEIFSWTTTQQYSVNMLINNVGMGKGGAFGNMNLKDMHYMMLLNNRVMVDMTHCFLPELKKHKEAYILSISSLEARLPLPYKAVYTGTKNFVYAFSLAIAQELKFSNIRVSVLCPGPVVTNQDGMNRMHAHGGRARLLMMYPGEVARIAVSGMLKGRQVIVPGFLNAVFFKLGSFLPAGVKMNILEKLFRVYRDH